MGTLDSNLLSGELNRILNQAVVRMDELRHSAVSAEVVLHVMLEDADNAAYWLLSQYQEERGLDLSRLTRQARLAAQRRRALKSKSKSELDFVTENNRQVRLADDMVRALDAALTLAGSDGEAQIGTDHLLFGMAGRLNLLRSHGILPKGAGVSLGEGRPVVRRPAAAARRPAAARPSARPAGPTIDHVAEFGAGRFPPVYFRDELLHDMVNILSQTESRHLILVGPDGVGKRTLAISLAKLIFEGEGPPGVKKLIQVNESILVGSNPLPAVEAGLTRAKDGGILFLPHIHRFFGGPVKAPTFYKEVAPTVKQTFLSKRHIIIGTTTDTEYDATLGGIPAITERSQVLRVPETSESETVEILKLLKSHLERDYDIQIADDALPVVASMAKRYLSGTPLPRAAEQLVHRACTIVWLAADRHLPEESSDTADSRVDAEDVTFAISRMTGIPASKLGADERTRYASMVEHLHQRIIGQEEAVQAVSRAVKTARVGLKDPKRPIGSFLFLGPTGVGKSELAKALAEFMFGSEDAMLQLDMSEFQNESTVNRLIGSPSGYVDSEAGGQLTERVRQQPYIIVLFDEVEKAHARVVDILLQVMEEGRLTDGRGNVANFSETVVIMTSNLGAHYLTELDIVDETGLVRADVRDKVMEEVRGHFRPEFLNRLSEIVTFHPLSPENLYDILGLMLRKDKKLAADRGLGLDFTEAARQFMLAQNDHPEWGARPLRRIIERFVREPLADFMLKENPGSGTIIIVDANEADGMFFEVSNSPAATT